MGGGHTGGGEAGAGRGAGDAPAATAGPGGEGRRWTMVRQEDLPIPGWLTVDGRPVTFPVVVATDEAQEETFYPLNLLCAPEVFALDARWERTRLQRHRILRHKMAEFPVRLPRGGTQKVWCLGARGVGMWLGLVDTAGMRPEVAERIEAHQWQLMAAADALIRGELEARRAPARLPGSVTLADVALMLLWVEGRVGDVETHLKEGRG